MRGTSVSLMFLTSLVFIWMQEVFKEEKSNSALRGRAPAPVSSNYKSRHLPEPQLPHLQDDGVALDGSSVHFYRKKSTSDYDTDSTDNIPPPGSISNRATSMPPHTLNHMGIIPVANFHHVLAIFQLPVSVSLCQ